MKSYVLPSLALCLIAAQMPLAAAAEPSARLEKAAGTPIKAVKLDKETSNALQAAEVERLIQLHLAQTRAHGMRYIIDTRQSCEDVERQQ